MNIQDNEECRWLDFSQKPAFSFQETFSPVIKYATVHVVLSLALSHKLKLRQIDIKNVFLHGDPIKEVYMIQPPCL